MHANNVFMGRSQKVIRRMTYYLDIRLMLWVA